MSDNTTINQGLTGDAIATEEVLTQEPQRGDARLPETTYKMPRSKIAVGTYGRDDGDAGPGNELEVVSRQERRLAEETMLAAIDSTQSICQTRCYERTSPLDRRGGTGQRGTRR